MAWAGIRRIVLHGGPWFVRRPGLAVTLSLALFVVIFTVRLTVGAAADDICLLYTLPIALLAITFGLRAGVLAGLAGGVLVVVWALIDQVHFAPVGWISRLAPMLLLGYLLGDAIDRLRRAEAGRRRLEAAARRQRDAIEINDSIVQGLSAAKWALESDDADGALAIVSETLEQGHRMVSELIRDADMSGRWSGAPGRFPGRSDPSPGLTA